MPKGMEHCCLTSCGFCFLPAQPPWGAQVGLSGRTVITVTLWDAYWVQALPGMSPSVDLGNRSKSHITALTVELFLALVGLHLATETGFLCGAESRVSLVVWGYGSQNGSCVLVTGQQQDTWTWLRSLPHSPREMRHPGARLLVFLHGTEQWCPTATREL